MWAKQLNKSRVKQSTWAKKKNKTRAKQLKRKQKQFPHLYWQFTSRINKMSTLLGKSIIRNHITGTEQLDKILFLTTEIWESGSIKTTIRTDTATITVGNIYTEDQLMNTFLDNFHQGGNTLLRYQTTKQNWGENKSSLIKNNFPYLAYKLIIWIWTVQ